MYIPIVNYSSKMLRYSTKIVVILKILQSHTNSNNTDYIKLKSTIIEHDVIYILLSLINSNYNMILILCLLAIIRIVNRLI